LGTDNLVKLSSYNKRKEADFVKSVLEDNGIEAVLKGEDLYGVVESNIGNYELYVLENDLKTAQLILESITDPSAELNLPEKKAPPADPQKIVHGTASIYFALTFLLIGFVIGLILSDKVKSFAPKQDYKKSYDYNRDGIADSWYYYVQGELVQQTYDRNFDGKIDEWRNNTDGVYGGTIEIDMNYNDVPDTCYYYKDGNISKIEIDLDENKIPDIVSHYKDDVVADTEVFDKTSRKPRATIEYKNGIKSKELIDTDGDGVFDKAVSYDEYGCFENAEKIK
jgi:hypothetical protein